MLRNFFDIDHIFFTALGYPMSYIEFFGVVFGLIAVWLSARAHILSWPVGIVNVILAFALYYQIQLYPDMFLQIFFLITNIAGWWRWLNPSKDEEDNKKHLKVSYMGWKQFSLVILIGIAGTFLLGSLASKLHEWFTTVFPLPSAYPYIDSLITVLSITTTFLMIEKKIESWIIWIIIDVVATVLYFVKGVKFYSFEYLIFTVLASYGLYNWMREYRTYSKT